MSEAIDDIGVLERQEGLTAPVIENVYQKINRVMGLLVKQGIGKDRENKQQSYMFRGIDDIYDAVAPALSEVGLLILPEVLKRTTTERPSKTGGLLTFVVLKVRYTFISADDGSQTQAVVLGEAMDSGDKATNKAMSAAYKYACMQAFCIPTEGQDSELDSPEISSVDMVKVNEIMETLDRIFEVNSIDKSVALIDESDEIFKELEDICITLDTNSDIFLKVWEEINSQFTDKLDGRSTVGSKMRAYIKEFNRARQG